MDRAANLWSFPGDPAGYLKELLNQRPATSLWLLCDRNTRKSCLPLIQSALPSDCKIITVPAGEKSKSLESLAEILKKLSRGGADRHSLLLCLGGGMICDLGGLAATLFKRGMRFIFLPTSLLCMADACLGGKNGIDFEGFKNQIGTFSDPEEIILLPGFLDTLPRPELLSGMAEIMKHALCSNPAVWNTLRRTELLQQNRQLMIEESLRFKQSVVEEDPLERSRRKILNAGHTAGHALESFFLERGLQQPHGFCIAAGLIIEGRIAAEKGFLPEEELLQVEEFVYAEYGMLPFSRKDIPRIVSFCRQDKKNRNGSVRASLFGPIGQCHTDVEITAEEMQRGLRYYLGK